MVAGRNSDGVREFAAELRALRVAAGSPSFRAMARTAHFAASTLAEATRGIRLPSRAVVEAFAKACGADPADWALRWKQASAGRPAVSPPFGPLPSPAGLRQLPPDLPDFVGRRTELAWLHRLPEAAQPVAVLSGAPGVGKSTLAVRFGHQVVDRFPDGQLHVDLHGTDKHPPAPAQIAARLCQILGMVDRQLPADPDALLAFYRSVLAERSVLLILDNAANERQVRPLLPTGRGCRTVITARYRLGGLEGVRRLHLTAPPEPEAAMLLTAIIGADRANAEPDAVTEIVARCGALPLALRVVGNNLETRPDWSLGHFGGKLAATHGRLALLQAGDVEVRSAFDLSYRRLSAEPARLFRLLPLVPGPDFDADLAAPLIGATSQATSVLLDVLADRSLLEPTAHSGRYRWHDLLQEFAAELLAEREAPEQRQAAADAVLRWILDRAVEAGARIAPPTEGPAPVCDREDAVAWLDLHLAHVLAAHERAAGRGWHRVVGPAVRALIWYFDLRCGWLDLLAMSETAVTSAELTGDAVLLAEVHNSRGLALHGLHRYPEAVTEYQAALACALRGNSEAEQSTAYDQLGLSYFGMGAAERAMDCHRRHIEICQRLGDRWGVAAGHNHLANALDLAGRSGEAIEHYRLAAGIFTELGDQRGRAMSVNGLGLVRSGLGQFAEAVEDHRCALAVFTEAGDRWAVAMARYGLGRALAGQGRLVPAHQEFALALHGFEAVPDVSWAERVRAAVAQLVNRTG